MHIKEIKERPVVTKVRTVEEWVEMIVGEDVAPKFKSNMFQGRNDKYSV